MPIIWIGDEPNETRATTSIVMAAIDRFCDWWVGRNQHDADLLAEMNPLPRFITRENFSEGGAR